MMLPYDADYAISPFGLQNTGVLCYFNALSQCLMSLPSFTKYMLSIDDDIVQEYTTLIKTKPGHVGLAYNLASIIHSDRQSNSFQWNIDPNRQEDIHEGFILMMESIDNHIDRIFNVRYKLSIVCHRCKHITVVPRESSPCDLVIDMGSGTYETKEDVEQYILSHSQIPDGYRCDHCSAQNTPEQPIISQRYDLAKLSSVIVLLYKYNQYRIAMRRPRITQFFPQTLTFLSTNGPLNYKICAYAEQFGDLSSGHYTATCLRPTVKKNERVINMDDERVTISSFRPSPNTYMVFYHLV